MAEVVWSKLALNDLEHIYDYISRDSVFYARKTIQKILDRVSMLTDYPEMGREVPEFVRNDIKELIEGNYRIFYLVRKNNVSIIRVHHAARNVDGMPPL